MVTQRIRLVVALVLCILLAPPATTQDEGAFEGGPTDFLPLEVGNQWTYQHGYYNRFYEFYGSWHEVFFGFLDDDPLAQLAKRLTMEIPGYPLFSASDDRAYPLEDLARLTKRELTLEITHTETIEGHTYFVFSQPAYDWPPVPTLCLAGQKVRFSDEGVLLIRQQEQDIPLYDFAPPYEYDFAQVHSDKDYTTPAYPVLYDVHDPVQLPLSVRRFSWDARLRIHWPLFYPPPLSFGPAFVTRFYVHHIADVASNEIIWASFGSVYFLANYGLARYEVWEPGFDRVRVFENSLAPVSAVIGGKKIAYPYVFVGTSVQPTSWGQLKARHGQEP